MRWRTGDYDPDAQMLVEQPRDADSAHLGFLRCLADGAPAHYRWDAAGPVGIPLLGLTFRPLAGDTYGVDKFTHPAFRGRGIDAVGVIAALHRAKERGFRRSIALVPPHNARSLSATRRKADRAVAGRVGYRGTGPLRRHYATGAVRLEPGGFSVRPGSPAGSGWRAGAATAAAPAPERREWA